MLATSIPPVRYVLYWQIRRNVLRPDCVKVTGYAADQLDQALEGAEVVVIPAGVPRKVGEFLKHVEIH